MQPNANGSVTGSFVVPRRVFDQLNAHKRQWPSPWTPGDYQTTWLDPSRLLLFVQFAERRDSMNVPSRLDEKPLVLKPAYSSVRVYAASFVGFYADLSSITPDVRHTIKLQTPETAREKL